MVLPPSPWTDLINGSSINVTAQHVSITTSNKPSPYSTEVTDDRLADQNHALQCDLDPLTGQLRDKARRDRQEGGHRADGCVR